MAGPRVAKASRFVFGERGEIVFESELQLVSVASFIAVSGIFVVSPILSDLTGVFGASDADIGLVMTAFTAPSIALIPIFGLLTDRLGRRPMLVGGLVTFGVAGVAIAFAPAVTVSSVGTFTIVLVLRFLQGIGFAAVMLVGVALLGDHYRGTAEITAQGVRFVAIQTATVGLPIVAGVMVLTSWRLPFALFAGAIVAGMWAWWALPEPSSTSEASVREYARNLRSLLADPILALVIVSFVFRFLLTFGFFTYISVLLRDTTDAVALVSGLAVAAFGLVSVISGSQIGRITAAFHPLLVLVSGFVLGGVGMAIMGLSSLLPVVFAGVAAFGLGNGLTAPAQKSFVNAAAPRELRGGAVSGAMLAQNVGQTIGPLVFGGLLTVASPDVAFVVAGIAVGVLGAIACWAAYLLLRGRTDHPFARESIDY